MHEVYVLHDSKGNYYDIDMDYNCNTVFIKKCNSVDYATQYEFLDNLYEDVEWIQSDDPEADNIEIIGEFEPVGYVVVEVSYKPIENRSLDLNRDQL